MFASVEKMKTQPSATSNHTLARERSQVAAPPVCTLSNQAALRGVPPVVNRVLGSSGRALDASARSFFEPRFGRDLSHVRVHTGALAAASAQAVAARAYAVGSHVVFDANEYAPGSASGRKLLAHELSHVVQNAGASPATPTRISQPGDRLEVAAERNAAQVLSSSPNPSAMQSSGASSAATLHRYTVPMSVECKDAPGWMDRNSPYAPEWAQTNCQYSFDGQTNVSAARKTAGGVSVTATGHPKLTVGVQCPTDLPEWGMGKPPKTQLAWMKMIRVLDAHEGLHRKKGQDWRPILEAKWRGVSVVGTGPDEAAARDDISSKLADKQQGWIKSAQDAQTKLDPFRGALLDCPDEKADPGLAPQPDNIGEKGQGMLPPQPAKLDEGNPPAQPKPLSPEMQKLFPPGS